MNREHISSDQLWFLLTVWETRSLTLAAQKLRISTATATRLMTAVRILFGDPLFLRGGEGLVPTSRMSALVPKLRALQEGLIDVARTEDVFDPSAMKRTIRIAGVDNAAFAFLMPALKNLYRTAPNLRLSFVPLTDSFTKHLESGRIDLALYAPPLKLGSDLREFALFRSDHVTVVRRNHPLERKLRERAVAPKALTPEDLQPYREILLTYGSIEGSASPGKIYSNDDAHVSMDCAYFLASVFFLLETDFYARLPRFTAEYLADLLPIAILPSEGEADAPQWCARMIWHERTDRDPALQWFRSMVAGELLGKDPSEVALQLAHLTGS